MPATLFYLANVGFAFGLLVASYWWPQKRWLEQATIENGPYEIATAGILILTGIWLAYRGVRYFKHDGLLRFACLSSAAVLLMGAGEEISWGQHWLSFESNEFFLEHNQQKETNLHNLMDPVVFSTIINVVIYGGFTLLPLLHWTYPNNPASRQLSAWGLARFIPNVDIALLLLLANCFHAWKLPATYSDTAVLIFCWLSAVILLLRRSVPGDSKLRWAILALCSIGFIVCWSVADIFRHANLQYEIRECFTVYVLAMWALSWSNPSIAKDH